MFKFKITPDRHNAGQKLIYCLLLSPPHSSLLSTLNVIMARLFTEICGGYAKKSFKWIYYSAPKVEQHYLQSITCLAGVNIKYNSAHGFAVFIHLATRSYINGTQFLFSFEEE
jgi:hypothetical protein